MTNLSPRNDYESYMIRDKIHVRLPSNDLGRSSWWHPGSQKNMEFYEKIDTDKDQFVAKQFRQIRKVDHNKILSHVAKPKSI